MSLMQTISNDRLTHRKNRDFPHSKLYAKILTTLCGEASMIGKDDGNRETTDDEVVKIIKKFIKGIDEIGNHRDLTHEEQLEIDLYKSYIPTTLSDKEVVDFITKFIDNGGECSMKMMGTIMKELKAAYPGRVDGKQASSIIKQILQRG